MDVGYLFALALGLLVGLGVGALRVEALHRARRAAIGASAGLARFLPSATPSRSATDILAGRVRVLLGGVIYDLPVLPRAASRRWLEDIDGRFARLGSLLEDAADDTPRILTLLMAESTALVDLLQSYDQSGRLPEREIIEEHATDAEILRAVIEVWRAANPLAAMLTETPDGNPTPGTSSEPPSGPRRRGAGRETSSSTA